jgi:hypothetical protein
MSIDNFVASAKKQLSELHKEREKLTGHEKGALTRKIHEIEALVYKATRRGIQE